MKPHKVKVTNYNKKGEVFDPRSYSVPYKGNEAAYRIIDEAMRKAEEK